MKPYVAPSQRGSRHFSFFIRRIFAWRWAWPRPPHFADRNPALHNTLAVTPARGSDVRVILLFCLVFSRLLKGLMDAADERSLQLFLLLSFPIHHPSIFSFHSPAPLLLSHTSLPLSFFEPTNLLLCGILVSLSFLTSFLFIPHPAARCHSTEVWVFVAAHAC